MRRQKAQNHGFPIPAHCHPLSAPEQRNGGFQTPWLSPGLQHLSWEGLDCPREAPLCPYWDTAASGSQKPLSCSPETQNTFSLVVLKQALNPHPIMVQHRYPEPPYHQPRSQGPILAPLSLQHASYSIQDSLAPLVLHTAMFVCCCLGYWPLSHHQTSLIGRKAQTHIFRGIPTTHSTF